MGHLDHGDTAALSVRWAEIDHGGASTQGHTTDISGSAATLILQAGTVNTVAIVPDATLGGFRLINLPRCS